MNPDLSNNKSVRVVLSLLFALLLAGVFSLSTFNNAYAAAETFSIEDRIRSVDTGGLTAEQFKVEPEEVGFPPFAAPKLKTKDYPKIMGVSSRSIVWVAAQMHLFFAAFVLAVPLFVLVIEWIGVKSGDERYDDMAHECMKISMTAFSITAIFGGLLAFALFILYPQFMGYMMNVFNSQVLVYALLF